MHKKIEVFEFSATRKRDIQTIRNRIQRKLGRCKLYAGFFFKHMKVASTFVLKLTIFRKEPARTFDTKLSELKQQIKGDSRLIGATLTPV